MEKISEYVKGNILPSDTLNILEIIIFCVVIFIVFESPVGSGFRALFGPTRTPTGSFFIQRLAQPKPDC